MPYHARFGHASDPEWISRQTAWLGQHLDVRGEPGERVKIWPIAQLADWGEKVPVEQVATVLEHGTHRPATGVVVFHWGEVAWTRTIPEFRLRCRRQVRSSSANNAQTAHASSAWCNRRRVW